VNCCSPSVSELCCERVDSAYYDDALSETTENEAPTIILSFYLVSNTALESEVKVVVRVGIR